MNRLGNIHRLTIISLFFRSFFLFATLFWGDITWAMKPTTSTKKGNYSTTTTTCTKTCDSDKHYFDDFSDEEEITAKYVITITDTGTKKQKEDDSDSQSSHSRQKKQHPSKSSSSRSSDSEESSSSGDDGRWSDSKKYAYLDKLSATTVTLDELSLEDFKNLVITTEEDSESLKEKEKEKERTFHATRTRSGSDSESDTKIKTKHRIAYFSPGIKSVLLTIFGKEQKGAVLAAYSFTDTDITNALVKQKTTIPDFKSCIFLNNKEKSCHSAPVQTALRKNGIPVLFHQRWSDTTTNRNKNRAEGEPDFFEDMHHKINIFFENDSQPLAIVGSYNLTQSAEQSQRNNIYLIRDPHCIEQFLACLEHLYTKRLPAVGQQNLPNDHLTKLFTSLRTDLTTRKQEDPEQRVTAYFNPPLPGQPSTAIMPILEKLFSTENKAIYAAQNYFTLYNLAQAWVDRKNSIEKDNKRTLKSKLVIDKEYSNNLCSALNVLIENSISVVVYNGPEQMHHKFIYFKENKDGLSALWTGSQNFTGQSTVNNWENGILAFGEHADTRYKTEFKDLFSRANRLLVAENSKSFSAFGARRLNGIPDSRLNINKNTCTEKFPKAPKP